MRVQFQRGHQLLVLAIVAVGLLPLPTSYLKWGGLPPEFLVFPPNQSGSPKPGVNWLYFAAGAAVGLVILAFLFFPQWFGFKEPGDRKRTPRRTQRLPWWFWLGLVTNAVSWWLHWFGTGTLVHYSFIPLWWGLIIALDGIVYYRTGGKSLMASETARFIVIALVSMPAWAFFEFLNYYAVEFWVYPIDTIFPPAKQSIWYLLSFSVVLPAIFEFYTLLHTFDGLWNRWLHGPKLFISRRYTATVFAIGCVAMLLFGYWPFELFWLLWVGPPLVLTAALSALRFWHPLEPIGREGNWSPAVLVALGSFATGIFWELWNYGSKAFRPTIINPNFWFYEIPYVGVFYPWSEMPILGYFGYLPFGVLAWVCWLTAAHILDLEPCFNLTSDDPCPPRRLADTPAPELISR